MRRGPAGRVAPAALALLAVALVALGTSPLWHSSARRLLGGRSFVAPDPAVHPSKWSGTEITEEVAQGLLIGLADNPRLVYDPVAIARNLPDVRFSFDWPEHEPGTVTFINDSHGFRRLPEEDATGADLTVLVLGDSQTYGLVDNDETFTSLLERRLTASGDGRRWAVLNAAVAGTGPHEYRGSLELHLPVRPDLVVAVFFTGNDFLNALRVDSFLRKGWSGLGDRDAQERYSQARQRWRSQLAQGVGQAQQFTVHPEQGRYAVQVCRDVFLEMSGLCRAHGAALLVVMLPCKAVVDGDDDQATITQLLETLQLRREQLDVNRWLGQRLAAELRQAGVEAVDLHEALEGPHPPLFWRSDHHLNVEGHALVAEALLPLVAERLSSPP